MCDHPAKDSPGNLSQESRLSCESDLRLARAELSQMVLHSGSLWAEWPRVCFPWLEQAQCAACDCSVAAARQCQLVCQACLPEMPSAFTEQSSLMSRGSGSI